MATLKKTPQIKIVDRKRSLAAKRGAATRARNRELALQKRSLRLRHRVFAVASIASVLMITVFGIYGQLQSYAATNLTTHTFVGLADKCLDNKRAVYASGNPVQLYGCNGTNAQKWTLASNGLIHANGTSFCLDVNGGKKAENTYLQVWKCNESTAQKFKLVNNTIVNTYSGLCVTVKNAETANGTRIWTKACHTGTASQKWRDTGVSIGSSQPSTPSPSSGSGTSGSTGTGGSGSSQAPTAGSARPLVVDKTRVRNAAPTSGIDLLDASTDLLRFTVHPGDRMPGDGPTQERAEYRYPASMPFGQDIWLSDDFKIDKFDYTSGDHYAILDQFRYTNDSGDHSKLSPEFAVAARANNDGKTIRLTVDTRSDPSAGNTTANDLGVPPGGFTGGNDTGFGGSFSRKTPGTVQRLNVNIPKGEWQRLVARIRFSRGGLGQLQMWLNGKQVFSADIPIGYNRDK